MQADETLVGERELELLELQQPSPTGAQNTKSRTVVLAIAVTCLNAVGNLALACGMKQLPRVGANPLDYLLAMVNPFVAAGIVLLILWLLARMALMSWADLSFALPLMAVGYIIAAVLGHFVLHETVNREQWIGTILIFGGCGLVGTTSHQTHQDGLRP